MADVGEALGGCAVALALVGSFLLIRFNDRRIRQRKAAPWEMVAASVEDVSIEVLENGRARVIATYGYQAGGQRHYGRDVTDCATRMQAEEHADLLRGQMLLAEYDPFDATRSRLFSPDEKA